MQPDLIQQDEDAAVIDHAFDKSPPPITGKPDLIYKDELAACDAAWMGKPWEKPAADPKPANNNQEKER